MKDAAFAVALALFGLSGGLVAGSAFVALLNALQVPARLAALTYTRRLARTYELALAAGAFAAALWIPFPFALRVPSWFLAIAGLFMGAFVGLLASALAETIGVIPVVARRTAVGEPLFKLIWLAAAGKILGSLAYWLFPPFTH